MHLKVYVYHGHTMFQLLELLAEIEDLRRLNLSEEEVDGFIELFFENYPDIFDNTEVV